MLYIDDEFMERYINPIRNDGDDQPKKPEDILKNLNDLEWLSSLDCDDEFDDDEFDDDVEEAKSQEFVHRYIEEVLSLTISFYPQFRAKEVELRDSLFEDGMEAYQGMIELKEQYVDSGTIIETNKVTCCDIEFPNSDSFIRNRAFDHLLENFDGWFKKKISFENIYVESFCAAVYVKHVHNLLKRMLHEFFSSMDQLMSKQLDEIYDSLVNEAWFAYSTLTELDPDELNDSTVLLNLEDYDYEDLLYWPGPTVIRNANGKISSIFVNSTEPDPDTLPVLCQQCKSYYNHDMIAKLCAVNRFDQRDSSDFRCNAFEKKQL